MTHSLIDIVKMGRAEAPRKIGLRNVDQEVVNYWLLKAHRSDNKAKVFERAGIELGVSVNSIKNRYRQVKESL